MITKLDAYGFLRISFQLVRNYLKNRKEIVDVNKGFIKWETKVNTVPKGSILGPLLFNNFLNKPVLVIGYSHQSNYTDINTLYCFSNNIYNVNDQLLIDLAQLSGPIKNTCY